MYWLYYITGIVLVPGIILGLWAQIKVQTTFNEYNKIQTKHGKPANVVARYMLDGGGCIDTKIGEIKGSLTDNYDPSKDTISLSLGTEFKKNKSQFSWISSILNPF